MADESQMDRIERKLDEVLAFRDLLIKLAMGSKIPGMRAKASQLAEAERRPQ